MLAGSVRLFRTTVLHSCGRTPVAHSSCLSLHTSVIRCVARAVSLMQRRRVSLPHAPSHARRFRRVADYMYYVLSVGGAVASRTASRTLHMAYRGAIRGAWMGEQVSVLHRSSSEELSVEALGNSLGNPD
jgi:hypothetical protein